LEAYRFHEGALPTGTTLAYEPSIFNQPAFLSLQDPVNLFSFYLLEPAKSRAVAGIHFQAEDNVARTPSKGPFGSIEFSEKLNPQDVYRFLEYIELRLKERSIIGVYIKNPPRAYAPEKWALVETFLLNQNYAVAEAEVGTVIRITDAPFSEQIRHSEKLRGRQAKEAGCRFQHLTLDKLGEVYRFISGCHEEKGYKLSLTEAELARSIETFPDDYFLFAVFQQETIRAASVGIRVSEKILYSFLVNHERAFNQVSPPVLLLEGMYDYCRRNSIALMDMGTSALNRKPNFSLLDFKLHMGGIPTSKLSFYKKIS